MLVILTSWSKLVKVGY